MALGARVLGFSEQWTAPTPRSPWRYGGAVRPAVSYAKTWTRQMTAAVTAIAARPSRSGASPRPTFCCDGEDALLLEINPRPGATLDIFDRGARPLLRLHLEAIREGKLPASGAEIR